MRIGLDYDDTLMADPDVWRKIIIILEDAGHDVVCVSSRFNNYENMEELGRSVPRHTQIVLCEHNAKAEVMAKRGTPVDVWIDDNPNSIDPDRTHYA